MPEKVSTRQRRYSLRHGVSRWPRVAFHKKRSDASTKGPFEDEYRRRLAGGTGPVKQPVSADPLQRPPASNDASSFETTASGGTL